MRNYQKENEWKRKKYVLIQGNLEKNLGLKLKEKLKDEKISIAGWITENAKKYLENK